MRHKDIAFFKHDRRQRLTLAFVLLWMVTAAHAANETAPGDGSGASVAWGHPVQGFVCGVESPATNVFELVLKNIGDGARWVSALPKADKRHAKCREFVVLRLLDSAGKEMPANRRGGLSGAPMAEIGAGQEHRGRFDVREYFDVQIPGVYQLQARIDPLSIHISQDAPGTNVAVESGVLMLAVDATGIVPETCGTGAPLTPDQARAAEKARAWALAILTGDDTRVTAVDLPFSWNATDILTDREVLTARIRESGKKPGATGLVYAVVEAGDHASEALTKHYKGEETNVVVTRVFFKGMDLVVFVRPGPTPKVIGFWE